MEENSFLRLLSMGSPEKIGIKKSLEGLPIPSSAELLEIYEVKAGKWKFYALEFPTKAEAEGLFNLYVRKYGRALGAERVELEIGAGSMPVLHRKTCCGGSYHSTLFQAGSILVMLKGCEAEEEAEERIWEMLKG